jgi:hypothetical protein
VTKTVACLIPLTWDIVPRQFFFSMMEMMAYARDKYEMLIISARAAILSKMHEMMVESILKQDVDYILHLDADEVYPKDTPERLIKHIDNGKDVVFGLVMSNSMDNHPLVYDFSGDRIIPKEVTPNSGLIEAGCVGMGGLMVKPDVYRRLQPPYFIGLPGFQGPDVNLCHKCREAGIKIWVDTGLHYGHITSVIKYPQG